MDKLEQAYIQILKELGVDLKDPNFTDTPKRVSKAMRHFFRNEKKEVIDDIKKKVFPSEHDQIVMVKDIECFGMCPHHLLPIVYNIAIGYIPHGKVLGLSKLARLAIAITSYPKLQEDITKEIADTLEAILNTRGIMVVAKGVHGCMRCRGIEMNSTCITSECRGILRADGGAKSEFLKLLGNGG